MAPASHSNPTRRSGDFPPLLLTPSTAPSSSSNPSLPSPPSSPSRSLPPPTRVASVSSQAPVSVADGCSSLSPEIEASPKTTLPSPSWASVVSKDSFDSGISLKYFPPPSPQGSILELFPPAEVIQQGDADWKSSLVGYFYEAPLNFFVVNHIARKIWAKFGISQIAEMENDFFLFRFANDIQMQECLKHGPWTFAGRPLFLKKWTPELALSKEFHKSFPLWVHLKGVPVHFWTPLGLSWIASAIGKPILLDAATAKRDRLKVARICVEVSASSDLPEKIRVHCGSHSDVSLGVDVVVEYPWKPGQSVSSRLPRTSKTHNKSPHKANPSGRPLTPAKAVKGSGVKDPLSPNGNSATQNLTAGPLPSPNPSKANFASLSDIDGIRPTALDSNSFAALTSPEAASLLSTSAGNGNSAANYPVVPAPGSILTGDAPVPPCEPPLVVDHCCTSQNLPSGEPLLLNEVQLDKAPSGPPSSFPSLPRSSRSARRVAIESAQTTENKDVEISLSNPAPKLSKGAKKKPPFQLSW